MSMKDDAVLLHAQGLNCAQCVLSACGAYTGLDDKTALAVSCGFGGGVRCGEICGAISGAVMAIGASVLPDDCGREGSARVAALTKQCTAAFREQFGALRCLDLKGAGVPCDDLIAFGAETAERIILDNRE